MEDEERQRKLQAGKAKLAEYRQRKAQSDGQKKRKKRKKGELEERESEGGDGGQTTVYTLRSGERVAHHQTYSIEAESEISTTAGDCSSEEDLHQSESQMEAELVSPTSLSHANTVEEELAAKSSALEELRGELEEIRAAFGADGVQQLQDFAAAVKQRDDIITRLTVNLQEAREEKEEVMREFLQLTKQSHDLQLQFQQLQAGESLRSSSISTTAAELLQARQQLQEKDTNIRLMQERLNQVEKERAEEQVTREQQLEELSQHLAQTARELQACEQELAASRLKEQMSSAELRRLMTSVDELQRRRAEWEEQSEDSQKVLQRHQSELESLKAQLSLSAADVSTLNLTLAELHEKLRESQVLREEAEQEVMLMREEKLRLEPDQSLRDTISILRAELDAAKASAGDLEDEHESEITNYKIKLDMLEREKNAVLDRMAESQEAELERVRTQLLFSHEEELSQLRDQLQRESLLNAENLRDHMTTRQAQATQLLRSDLEAKLMFLESERSALQHEVAGLKDLQVQQSARAEELLAHLRRLQEEVRQVKCAEPELPETQEAEQERRCLRERLAVLEQEREGLLRTVGELQEEVERQRNTFSFAERNFQVNYQELKEEYTAAMSARAQLQERLMRDAAEYESRLRDLLASRGGEEEKKEEETDGRTCDAQLMEKLQTEASEMKHSATDGEVRRREEELRRERATALGASAAAQERESRPAACAHTHTHTPAAADEEPDDCHAPEQQERAVGDDVRFLRSSCLMRMQEMEGSEHEECRLQLEAQRISLSQIHAAQLELLRERDAATPAVDVQRLQRQFQACSAQLEERHVLELQRLKIYYTQQLQETQERLMEEILLLQTRLQELSGEQQSFSEGRVCPALVSLSQGELSTSSSCEHRVMAEREESGLLQEQIAKVIVQMSIDFAQQTESVRLQQQEARSGDWPDHVSTVASHACREREPILTQQLTERGRALPSMQCVSTQTETVIEKQWVKGHSSDSQDISSDDITIERDELREVLFEVLKTTEAVEGAVEMLESSSGWREGEMSGACVSSSERGAPDVTGVSRRLHCAVDKLILAITDTSAQLEHARVTQTELMREKFRHSEEMEELQRRQEELQERVCEEERAREQLALELHRAEGVIDEYSGERQALEQQVRERAEQQLHLEQELHITCGRLNQLEQERDLIGLQHDVMKEGAGPRELRLVEAALDAAPEADLLEETEKLMLEKVEVQRQAQKESGELQRQVKQLEAELEEQLSRLQQLQEVRRTESDDLTQQIQALEKQLEKNRRFMDEQAADREHERDVFQQEILSLEEQLKNLPRAQTGSDSMERELQDVSVALQEKSDWCSELLLCSEQLRRDVQERDEEIETLGGRVRELEHTLMQRVEEVKSVLVERGTDVTLENQLQTEREALDRKEKEICNLEEQLEQFREELENKSEELNLLHMQLEIQRKEISSQQHHLQVQARLAPVLEERERQVVLLTTQVSELQGRASLSQALEERERRVCELEAQVELVKRRSEEEAEQLNAVIERLQEELSLTTPQSEHHALQSKSRLLEERLQEALREKAAACVVVRAQVQALEESAGGRVEALLQRVRDLEACVEEKEAELRCGLLREEQLEETLRESTAAALVSHAQLEAVRSQSPAACRTSPAQKQLQESVSETQECAQRPGAELLPDQESAKLLVQERERRIALLTDQLHRDQQLLQEVKGHAAAVEEELSSCRTRGQTLQEELEGRDAVIAQLREHEGSVPQEIISLTLKMEQMQELHAAEIMDMETRHISESDSLRRERHVLQEQCRALRHALHATHTAEVTVVTAAEGSDSSSDWSRHTGAEVRITPEGERRDAEADVMPDSIRTLLREVHQEGLQVLSLSEQPLSDASVSHSRQTDTLIRSLESLKLLLAPVMDTPTPVGGDWRAELLRGVQQVFVHEREVLDALVKQLDASDPALHLKQLQEALTAQEQRQQCITDILSSAERRSLMSEIQHLHTLIHNAGSAGPDHLSSELNQTTSELQNCLTAENTHLRELHTLQSQGSLKEPEQWRSTQPQKIPSDRKLETKVQLDAQVIEISGAQERARQLTNNTPEAYSQVWARLQYVGEELEQERLQGVRYKSEWEEQRHALSGLERRVSELRAELEAERASVQRLERERDALRGEESRKQNPEDRTRDWVLQQKTTDALTSDPGQLRSIRSRLQLIADAVHSLSDARSSVTQLDRETLIWLHTNVQEVMSLLQPLPSVPSSAFEVGGVSLLNERMLRQNGELTGLVSRVTEEKNELRNRVLLLEEELRRARRGGGEGVSGAGARAFSRERDCWFQERRRLEAELSRLKAELRSDAQRDLGDARTDSTSLKRMYGRFLRAESFRKALVYQKRFLLLLLGGFEDCEEASLALIARMGGAPEVICSRRSGFTRFRSAVRVAIALCRMRFLVRRWQRMSGNISRNGLITVAGSDVRHDVMFLQPGSLENSDRQNNRGRESPRSNASVHHRCVVGEGGLVPCSHLLTYDPDRALTDYIARLEALQRRLGSVQSGSSFTQLSFGVRR